MAQVSLQLELQRFRRFGNWDVLCIAKFDLDEQASVGQLDPMINARGGNAGRLDHLPHVVHQTEPDFVDSFLVGGFPPKPCS